MAFPTLNPLPTISGLARHRYLIAQLTRRDVLLKYRGSFLGISWSFFYPLLLLAAFGLVFGQILGTRWPQNAESGLPLVLVMYAGLIVYNFFSEVASAAPRFILGYQSLVKKNVFPTEVLPVVLTMSATIHAAVNAALLLAAVAVFGKLHAAVLLVPLVFLPAWLLALGVAWFLAAAGVFVRDIIQVIPVLMQVLLFLSPVFYPVSAVPDFLRWMYDFSPLTALMEDFRRVCLWGQMPQWDRWAVTTLAGLAVALAGLALFRKGQGEFADAL